MAPDLCPACGEEHEPPRGVKCKRTRLVSAPLKQECVDMSDTQDSHGGSSEDQARRPRKHTSKAVRRTRGRRHAGTGEVEVTRDEEERQLRKRLEQRECERRKRELRTALEEQSGSEVDAGEGATGGAKGSSSHKQRDKDLETVSEWSDTSTSDSSDTSDSETDRKRRHRRKAKKKRHRKRSKFDINKFIKNEKSIKKLTVLELLFAALVWGMRRAERVGMTMKEVRGYMGHLSYMVMHAMTGAYTDSAYREYDKAVRRKVKERGMRFFKQGDQELSLLFFNLDNVKNVKDSRRQYGAGSNNTRYAQGYVKPTGACYAFNYDKTGCKIKSCVWDHVCIVCRSQEHAIGSCPKKRY